MKEAEARTNSNNNIAGCVRVPLVGREEPPAALSPESCSPAKDERMPQQETTNAEGAEGLKPKKKKGRKDLYGIQGVVDTFATNALTQAKGATILKKYKELLDEAGLQINAKEIKEDLVQQHRFQSIIVGSVRSYDRLFEAGLIEEQKVQDVWKH